MTLRGTGKSGRRRDCTRCGLENRGCNRGAVKSSGGAEKKKNQQKNEERGKRRDVQRKNEGQTNRCITDSSRAQIVLPGPDGRNSAQKREKGGACNSFRCGRDGKKKGTATIEGKPWTGLPLKKSLGEG